MTENLFKATEAISDFFFLDEANFIQTDNLSGQGTLSTQEGTWLIIEKDDYDSPDGWTKNGRRLYI